MEKQLCSYLNKYTLTNLQITAPFRDTKQKIVSLSINKVCLLANSRNNSYFKTIKKKKHLTKYLERAKYCTFVRKTVIINFVSMTNEDILWKGLKIRLSMIDEIIPSFCVTTQQKDHLYNFYWLFRKSHSLLNKQFAKSGVYTSSRSF